MRLALVMALLAVLPAVPAALVTRDLIGRGLTLSLSNEMDAALSAGLRGVREDLLRRQQEVQDVARAWATRVPPGAAPPAAAAALRALRPAPGAAQERVVLFWPDGAAGPVEPLVVQAGDLPKAAAALAEGAPPATVRAAWPVAGGGRVEVERALPEAWRQDAAQVATGLQLSRGLRAQRARVLRGFLAPLLLIYGLALLLALASAVALSRGVTAPLARLVKATDRVAGGDWSVQVPAGRPDEVGRLTERFNAMVGTLAAQRRRLTDLQTMAGWREMARALAHEVKNPLTPIQLTVEEMRARYAGDDAQYRALLQECTRIVVEEVDSLRRVVARFREFSRPVEPRPRALDLNALLQDLAALHGDLAPVLDLQEGLGEIEADEDLLRQLLMNLADNSRHALAGRADARLILRSRADSDWVVVEIEDNGPGIPPSLRERVFEPYHSGRAGGLGLGLALVKGIALAHGGSIAAAAGAAGGARFVLQLPRPAAGAPGHPTAAAPPSAWPVAPPGGPNNPEGT